MTIDEAILEIRSKERTGSISSTSSASSSISGGGGGASAGAGADDAEYMQPVAPPPYHHGFITREDAEGLLRAVARYGARFWAGGYTRMMSFTFTYVLRLKR
jgi:hypothetical protein